MASVRFAIRRSSTDLMEISFSGALDAATVIACERDARAALSVVKPGHVKLVIELGGMTEYTLEAREALIDFQSNLADKVSCTAYVADSAERRGLALWVAHMTRQHSVRCFTQSEDAVAWLRGFHGPVTAVRTRALASAVAIADDDVDEAAN